MMGGRIARHGCVFLPLIALLAATPALAECPTAPLTGALEVTYGDRISRVALLPDGTTADRERATDGAYGFDYVTHPMGLALSAQEVEGGRVRPETVETVTYEGAPLPDPQPGARWSGREISRYADGRVTAYATEATVGAAETYWIEACAFDVLPIVVTRVEDGLPGADAEAYIYLTDLGVVLYMGYGTYGEPPLIDPPLAIGVLGAAELTD